MGIRTKSLHLGFISTVKKKAFIPKKRRGNFQIKSINLYQYYQIFFAILIFGRLIIVDVLYVLRTRYSVSIFQFLFPSKFQRCSHRRHNRSEKIVELYVRSVYPVMVLLKGRKGKSDTDGWQELGPGNTYEIKIIFYT